MIHRILSTIVALSMAAPAFATFELKDPAAEMLEAEKAKSPEAIAGRACFDFLVDSVERKDVYRASVKWVRDTAAALQEGGGPTLTEASLREYCVDHPRDSLAEAAAALGVTPGAD